MSKLYLDLSGRSGLAPKHQGDINDTDGSPSVERRYLGSEGQMADGVYNPLRNFGYMSPATNNFVSITESDGMHDIDNEIKATIYDSNSQDYLLAQNGRNLWYGDDASDITLTHAVNLASANLFTDLEIYEVNGVRKLFYAYHGASNGDIGISNLPFASNDDDWLSTAPVGAFNTGTNDVFMRVADNGFMYILDGNSVHKVDGSTVGGANGTVTANVLTFPVDFNIVDGFDDRGSLWLGIQTASLVGVAGTASFQERVVGVYVWDRQSTIVRMRDFIPIKGVKEIRSLYLSPKGDVRAIVISSERITQIRQFNGTTFEIIEELGIAAYPNYRDSVSQLGGLTIWYGSDGFLYAHGSLFAGEKEELYKLGDTTAVPSGTFTTGAILLADANSSLTSTRSGIIFSVSDSSNDVIKVWHPHGVGSINSTTMTGNQGNVYTLVQRLPTLSKINYMRIYHFPASTSGSTVQGTLKIYFNNSTTAWGSISIMRDDIARGYLYITTGESGVFSIQVEIEWATGVTLSETTDWRPHLLEIDYNPTTKLK